LGIGEVLSTPSASSVSGRSDEITSVKPQPGWLSVPSVAFLTWRRVGTLVHTGRMAHENGGENVIGWTHQGFAIHMPPSQPLNATRNVNNALAVREVGALSHGLINSS
jgi:hypothetical protein